MDNMEYIATRLRCTEEEKVRACEVVRRLYRYTLQTRMYGVLALEEAVNQEESEFLRDCLTLVADGMDPDRLREYMAICILAENTTGGAFLEQVLIADGVLLLQRMENPHSLLFRLAGWFGLEFRARFQEETASLDKQIDALVQENAGRGRKNRTRSLCPAFDDLAEYSDEELQRILTVVTSDELALALMAAGNSVYQRVATSLNEQRQRRLLEDMDALRYVRDRDTRRAQERILEVAGRQMPDDLTTAIEELVELELPDTLESF